MNSALEQQRRSLLAGNPTVKLVRPCRINDGISKIPQNLEQNLLNRFETEKDHLDITFFIPASGSGSRMFDNLYDFLVSDGDLKPKTYESIEKLLNRFKDFALYNLLPRHFKLSVKNGTVNIKELVEFLLTEKGLNLGNSPKGLIPFHRYGKFIISPFQEHVVQGAKIAGDNAHFHFTINRKFEDKIEHNLSVLKEVTGIDFIYTFTEQNKATDAFTFNQDNQPIIDEDSNYLMRPAGHGALIENLNTVEADIVFIKNIDNVQHYTKAQIAIRTKKILGGQLIKFQKLVHNILHLIDQKNNDAKQLIIDLNEEYQLKLTDSQIGDLDFIYDYLNRPIRICGMVPNEGQIGGGPFWVEDDTKEISKQIIEKSQISSKHTFESPFLRGTHFNPVEIICAVKNYKGEKFNLSHYTNESHYFLVSKKHQGQDVRYIEKPGLWNGGMYNWLTLFFEIDPNCFSPVKNLTDLLNPLHLEKK